MTNTISFSFNKSIKTEIAFTMTEMSNERGAITEQESNDQRSNYFSKNE